MENDLSKDAKKDVFFTCITGDYNFKNQELEEELNYPRSIWMDDEEDENIPTVTSKDKLVYVSSTDVPDSIVFERFADYGYTIGVSNLIKDMGGHYYIEYMDVDDEANEENESDFMFEVERLISQIEIYDQVWFVRHMPEDRKHSAEAKLLVKDFIAALEEIPDGCAETFPFELIEDLRREYFPD